MELAEVRPVLSDLTAADRPFWVGGGWGVDALVGHQTRRTSHSGSPPRPADLHELALLVSPGSGPDVGTFVAVDPAGRVVGLAATDGTGLRHFGTAIATWGTGLAQDVFDAVLERMLPGRPWLRVLEENLRARLYERLGWPATGEETRSPFAPFPALLTYERP